MKPVYVALTFDMKGFDPEIWMALLSEWPFESFHEESDQVIAYIRQEDLSADLESWLDTYRQSRYLQMSRAVVMDQNWNALWESAFSPVEVGSYCYIRAAFHPPAPSGFKHEVVIAPKMAFGTGHHATTYMMIDAMSHLDFKGKDVFDFGCGTGILSVVAALEGAAGVTGVDIQPEAMDNSQEHAEINKVIHQCRFYPGGLELAEGHTYDIMLANINTHVIAAHLHQLKSMLRPGGFLLLSGIMLDDAAFVDTQMDFSSLIMRHRQERGEWLQMTFQKEVNRT